MPACLLCESFSLLVRVAAAVAAVAEPAVPSNTFALDAVKPADVALKADPTFVLIPAIVTQIARTVGPIANRIRSSATGYKAARSSLMVNGASTSRNNAMAVPKLDLQSHINHASNAQPVAAQVGTGLSERELVQSQQRRLHSKRALDPKNLSTDLHDAREYHPRRLHWRMQQAKQRLLAGHTSPATNGSGGGLFTDDGPDETRHNGYSGDATQQIDDTSGQAAIASEVLLHRLSQRTEDWRESANREKMRADTEQRRRHAAEAELDEFAQQVHDATGLTPQHVRARSIWSAANRSKQQQEPLQLQEEHGVSSAQLGALSRLAADAEKRLQTAQTSTESAQSALQTLKHRFPGGDQQVREALDTLELVVFDRRSEMHQLSHVLQHLARAAVQDEIHEAQAEHSSPQL